MSKGVHLISVLFFWTIFFLYSYYFGLYWVGLLNSNLGALSVLNGILVIAIPIGWFFVFIFALGSLFAEYD
jgi:hypothetical protein